MGRGIETSKIFRTRNDREDFIDGLAGLCRSGRWSVELFIRADAQRKNMNIFKGLKFR